MEIGLLNPQELLVEIVNTFELKWDTLLEQAKVKLPDQNFKM